MARDGWAVVTAEEMRRLEAAAFASGISEGELQANAAAQIAGQAAQMLPPGALAVVLAGPGNNGRDAFLAGRILAGNSRRVFYYLGPRHAVLPEELAALDPAVEQARVHGDESDLVVLRDRLTGADLAIDGLLGIGVRGPLRPPLDLLARVLNETTAPRLEVLSVDVPSGIDADSGAIPGEAVRADVTVALGAAKAGTLRFPGAELVGRLVARPIGLPEGADAACVVRVLERQDVGRLVPRRPLDGHKGTLGWVMVVGGSREYVGAPILSASSAARSGCGLVALAVPPNAQAAAAAAIPEATYLLREPGVEPSAVAERIIGRLSDFRSLVLGPGLGREDGSEALVRELLQRLGRLEAAPPVVIDADALYALAQWPDWSAQVPAGGVLTPHHGEMARLTGLSPGEVGARSWDLAIERAVAWRQVLVLKGPHTVVASPDGRAWVHPHANPALASAGTGDVLAGLIGGLIAQGLEPLQAARLGVVAHGLAAERVLETRGWRSLLASDLVAELPAVLRALDGGAGSRGKP